MNSNQRIKGLSLKVGPLGENDRLLTILSEENGISRLAIAKAKKPFEMALAFKNAVIAGRQSYLAGRIEKTLMGNPSSPKKGII